MRAVLLAVLADRTFLTLVSLGLAVQLITLYLWFRFFGIDPVVAKASIGIFALNLVLGVLSHERFPAYSYLLVTIPLLLVAIDYGIVFSLR
ncbi:hypothetical protein HYZ64_02775 [Candidatus Berkelbacteria bacterium]|nr:hypothetical protein [Candidatus Berkelbacteria bacterium]